jgi:hypothetical protein
MRKMFPALTLTGVLKVASTAVLLALMTVSSPLVLHHRWILVTGGYQQTMPERMAAQETKSQSLEQRVKELEDAKLEEKMAVVEARQELVLGGLLPVGIFMLTSAWETVQRMRGEKSSHRSHGAGG